MTLLRFAQVDAFTDRPFAGNPAAVILLDEWLDDVTLQAIASENNLDETAPERDCEIVSHAFPPFVGINEDSVAGTAHALVTPYWAKRLGRARITAYQASTRGGELVCTLAGDRVIIEGKCVTVIEGRFRL